MKAKEYFEKYRKLILEVEGGRTATLPGSDHRVIRLPKTDEELDAVITEMYVELRSELFELMKKLNIQTDKGFMSAVKEINDKYNAIAGLFETEYGWSPIARNGFKDAIMSVIQKNLEAKQAPRLADSEVPG